ncbi:hypothetical protein CCL15_14295, partial [Pseudomonas syringae]
TYVALCVVSAVAVEKHFIGSGGWVSHSIVFASEIVDAERHERHADAERRHDSQRGADATGIRTAC